MPSSCTLYCCSQLDLYFVIFWMDWFFQGSHDSSSIRNDIFDIDIYATSTTNDNCSVDNLATKIPISSSESESEELKSEKNLKSTVSWVHWIISNQHFLCLESSIRPILISNHITWIFNANQHSNHMFSIVFECGHFEILRTKYKRHAYRYACQIHMDQKAREYSTMYGWLVWQRYPSSFL